MNTDESELALFRAERRVREIQAKLHRWADHDPQRDLWSARCPETGTAGAGGGSGKPTGGNTGRAPRADLTASDQQPRAPEQPGQRHSVLFDDLGGQFDGEGLPRVLTLITELVERAPCSVLVIDSFRALRYQSRDEGECERFIHELAGRLTATGTRALWPGEYSKDELASRSEFNIADAALVLATEENERRTDGGRARPEGPETARQRFPLRYARVRVGPTAREFGHPRPRP